MHDFLVAAVSFIVLIAVMVVVHELGHFAVAKLCGVRVEAFSLGFGPRLFGIKYGDTDYKVCLLPLGGFVKMTGEYAEQNLEAPGKPVAMQVLDAGANTRQVTSLVDDPGAFTSHPRWQRMLIGVAGPVANFILAFALMVFYFGWINEVPDIKNPTLEWVSASSAAARAGLESGDVIVQYGSARHPDLETVADVTRKSSGQTLPIAVERGGQTIQTTLRLPNTTNSSTFALSDTGMYLEYVQGPIGVDSIAAGEPAEQAGLRAGDRITAVDGHAFHTLDPFVDYLQAGKGQPITLTVERGGVTVPPIVVHPFQQGTQWRIGFGSVPPADPQMKKQPLTFAESLTESVDFCAGNSLGIVD
ncbi:MAG TPA: RIP metalloprotease RseP, partial [Terracidiphilus sp.]|nr:RIP metalloprotease RseP [Terracidiphilus sp.]